MNESRPFDLHLSYMRGFMCGAGCKTIPQDWLDCPPNKLSAAFFSGHKDGKAALRGAGIMATDKYGYTPNIIRTMNNGGDDGQ